MLIIRWLWHGECPPVLDTHTHTHTISSCKYNNLHTVPSSISINYPLLYLCVGHKMYVYEYPLFFVVSHPFLSTFSWNHHILIIFSQESSTRTIFILTRTWVEHDLVLMVESLMFCLLVNPHFFVHTLVAYSYYSQLLLKWWYHQQFMIPNRV